MIFSAEQERDFVRDHLGPAFSAAGLKTRIWSYDHNLNERAGGDDPGRLLLVNPATLCTSCHGAAGSGANTNVDDGRYLSTRDDPPGGNWNHGAGSTADNGNLLGGGFVNYKGAAMTSNHTLGQTNTWGQNATDRGTATALAAGATLQCVSCHDPHGSTNYRIMKTTVNGAAVAIA